jgi:hypothetical protein
MTDIPIEIFTKFNSVKFNDEIHQYDINGKKLISVTSLIGKYKNKFDEDYWSEYKANEFNLPQHKILSAWSFINKKATLKGSIVHNYAENLFNNKFFPYPKDLVIETFGYDPIFEDFLKSKVLVDKFYKDSFNKLIPIKTEYVVVDSDIGIGGMVDLLVYNVKCAEFQIWDYKTNKELSTSSRDKLKGSLCDLYESDIEVYSLQLSAYKYIIEKYINIKLGPSYLVWVNEKNDNYKIIPTIDRTDQIKKIFREYSLGLVA